MTRKMKRLLAGVAAFVMVLTLLACESVQDPTGTTAPSTVPTTQPSTEPTTSPTVPSTAPTVLPSLPSQIGTGGTLELEQLRRNGYQKDWLASFRALFGDSLTVTDSKSLSRAMSRLNMTLPEGYDASFFQDYFLVLIPMQSGSGSVRYAGQASVESGTIRISLYGMMGEVGTADMADWLVLVTMPRNDFHPDARIEVNTNHNGNTDPDWNVSDR